MEIPVAQTIPLKGLRRVLADVFTQGYSVPQVTKMGEIDATELIKLRSSLVDRIEREAGIRITYTHLLLKALAQALKEYPYANSNLVDDEIRILTQVNISLVVVTEDDLNLGPVIREVDKKSIITVAQCAKELAERVRKGKFTKEDFLGGTCTLSNLGMFGQKTWATVLLTPPQTSAVLVGAWQDKPVVRGGEIVIRPIMPVSLTYDHRAMTGSAAGEFLLTFTDIVEHADKLELGI